MDLIENTIWTIGHSTRTIDEFIGLLQSFDIRFLADIRRFPGSKRYPHFSSISLAASLKDAGISYRHFEALGGRRTPVPDSANMVWQNASFRGYADYMETGDFKIAINELEAIALKQRTAYMCSEAVWWRCHRALVSDGLKSKGWKVMHIMAPGKAEEHPYTAPARAKQGNLFS